jgi:hypothetical protein
MKEIKGNLWEQEGILCITTNNFVKNNGCAVMGRGCAKEASIIYTELPRKYGAYLLKKDYTSLYRFTTEKHDMIMFPVKHNWFEQADVELIKDSARKLAIIAQNEPHRKFILPRPGCGNGHLEWSVVMPAIEKLLPDNVLVITW